MFDKLKPNTRKRVLDDLYARVERAVENNEKMTWDSLLPMLAPHNIRWGTKYKGWMNSILLGIKMMDCKGDPRFVTPNGCMKMGGGKPEWTAGMPIWRPKTRKVWGKNRNTGEKEKITLFQGWSTVWVVNVRETDLIAKGIVPDKLAEENKDTEPKDVQAFLGRISFDTEECNKGNAYYQPASDKIGVPDFKVFQSAFGWADAMCHEMIHWTGHGTRLDRDGVGKLSDKATHSYEELVACIGSTFLLKHLGVPLGEAEIDRQGAYLKGWLKHLKLDMELLFRAAKDAGKAVDFLIEAANDKVEVTGRETVAA